MPDDVQQALASPKLPGASPAESRQDSRAAELSDEAEKEPSSASVSKSATWLPFSEKLISDYFGVDGYHFHTLTVPCRWSEMDPTHLHYQNFELQYPTTLSDCWKPLTLQRLQTQVSQVESITSYLN